MLCRNGQKFSTIDQRLISIEVQFLLSQPIKCFMLHLIKLQISDNMQITRGHDSCKLVAITGQICVYDFSSVMNKPFLLQSLKEQMKTLL